MKRILFAFALVLTLQIASVTNPSGSAGAQSLPPLIVTDCSWAFDNPDGGDWDITVAISFENGSQKTITDAKFEMRLIDAFGKTLQTESGAVSGIFSPSVEIKPRKGLNGNYFTQPDSNYPSSPAWDISNFSENQVKRVRCAPIAAAFEDGTSWTAPGN